MANYPKYDNDTATKGYVDNLLKNQGEETTEKISTIPKSYSAPPAPPYYKDSLLAYENKIYKCINDKVIGEFSWNDWAVVATDDTSLNSFISDTYGPEMDLKANDADLTGAELIIRINADTTQALLKASKINLTADDIIKLIAGNSINLTSREITINSTNFNVDKNGNITATSGTIGGFTLGQNTFSSNLTFNQTYTSSDVTRVQQIILGNITPTSSDYTKYDLTHSGSITILDLLIVQKLATGAATGNGTYTLNTNKSDIALQITRDGAVVTNLGAFGNYMKIAKIDSLSSGNITTDSITAGNIDCGSCVLDSGSSDVRVYFNKTFASAPKVFLTPYTSKTGVIAAKVKNITTTYFDATIGGNIGTFSDVNYNWLAIG